MRKFIIELLFFFGAFSLVGIVFEQNLIALVYPEFGEFKKAILKEDPVIFFGSSVNKFCGRNDLDRRSLSEMLDDELDDFNVSGVSHGGYHAGIYYSFLVNLSKSDKKPLVVIPINLRTFSPEWNLRPAYQFTHERGLLEHGLSHSLKNGYEEISLKEFKTSKVIWEDKIAMVNDFEQITNDTLYERIRGFHYAYLQPLESDNPKLIALKQIVELSKRYKYRILLYITPVDFQEAAKLGVKDFKLLNDKNISFLQSEIDFKIFDFSYLLDSIYFEYNMRPNEHMNEYGKLILAKELAKCIL